MRWKKVPKAAYADFAKIFGAIYFMGILFVGDDAIGVVIESEYIVMRDGTVYRYTAKAPNWRLVNPRPMSAGYSQTRIHGRDILTHRLVADCFCPNPSNYPEVNHIDGNKKNNDASNLEWCTRSMNMKHAYATGLHGRTGRSKVATA